MGRRNRKVSEGSRVETGTHRSESREISIPSAVGVSSLQAGEDVNAQIAFGKARTAALARRESPDQDAQIANAGVRAILARA
jgi:hypothetical protein